MEFDSIRTISILSTSPAEAGHYIQYRLKPEHYIAMATGTRRQQVRESFSQLPGHLIRRAHQVATAFFAEECGGDLTAVQYAALVAIGAHPGIDATRLSEIIYFDRSTIGDVLDRIEGKGWIQREATPHDRRIKLLKLSTSGHETLRQVQPGIRRVQDRLTASLTAAEAKTLIRLLARVADAAEHDGDHD
jgi:DNA-binding MarR family transcriptional regulator